MINCPECGKDKKSYFDKQSIKLLKMCVDCKIKWENSPENDPENNMYRIRYSWSNEDEVTIYAKSKEDAERDFWDNYAEEPNTEIDYIDETKREKLNQILTERRKQREESKIERMSL